MKIRSAVLLCLALFVIMTGSLRAENVNSVAVLPFAVNSSESIDYVRNGVWDMLISRLSSGDEIRVIGKEPVLAALKRASETDMTASEICRIGEMLHVDYVVWGSITKIGNSISLDGKLFRTGDCDASLGVYEQCRNVDEVIPKVDIFAKRISDHLLGREPVLPAVPVVITEEPVAVAEEECTESESGLPDATGVLKSEKGTLTSIVAAPAAGEEESTLHQKEDFWMSKKYGKSFKGMDIGDVDGDGLNEVVLIDDNNVYIYRHDGGRFELLKTVSGGNYDNYLSVDVADINRNGRAEIFVSNIRGELLDSFVIEYENGAYKQIASGLRWFMRSIASSPEPVVVAQSKSIDSPYNTAFDSPIYKLSWRDGSYEKGRQMAVPRGLPVYGLNVDSLDYSGILRVVALDEYDHICVYRKTTKPLSEIHVIGGSDELLWKSDEVYGGSTTYFKAGTEQRKSYEPGSPDKVYVRSRILISDTDHDGRKEVVIVRNMSSIGRILKNLKVYNRSEICSLAWDGIGLQEKWKTKKIQGYVADYQLKDIDNDGQNEIVLAVGITSGKSAVVAYELKK